MNVENILFVLLSLLLIGVGFDKFHPFLEPPCSLEAKMPVLAWKSIGIMQLIIAILVWQKKIRQYLLGFFLVFMLFIIGVHLLTNTYDIGGALCMAGLSGLLVWKPKFIKVK